MEMKFYNVNKRQSVNVPINECSKIQYSRDTDTNRKQYRYALRAIDNDGTNMTKFITKETYDSVDCPVFHKEAPKKLYLRISGSCPSFDRQICCPPKRL